MNFGAFIAFMGVNVAAMRLYYFKAQERGFKAVLVYLLPPLLGFVICLYIWWSLRTPAKLLGGCWLLIGAAYYWWLTGGLRRAVRFAELDGERSATD